MRPTDQPAMLVLEIDSAGRVLASGDRTFHINLGPGPLRKRDLAVAAAAWEWDGHRLTARTSETGLVPIYYSADGTRFAISTSLAAIQRRLALFSLDWPAIVICLATGQFIGDNTFVDGVHALPIRSSLRWEDGHLDVTTDPLEVDRTDLDFESAISRYISEMRESVSRNLPEGPATLMLSGGRDSRHILLELLRQHQPPRRIVTSGHYLTWSAADTDTAAALGTRSGFTVRQVRPGPDRIRAEIEKNHITEWMTLSHSWALPLARDLSSSAARFDGMNGGALFGRSNVMVPLRARFGEARPQSGELLDAAVELMLDAPLARVTAMLQSDLLSREMIEEARIRMRNELLHFVDYPNPVQAYRHVNSTTRDIAMFTYRMFGNQEVSCPLDDVAVARFGLGLPWKVSTNPSLQTEALRAHFPDYADIPFAEEIARQTRSADWDSSVEAATAARLADAIEHDGQFRLSEAFEVSLRSGNAQLRPMQIATYLWQLLGGGHDI